MLPKKIHYSNSKKSVQSFWSKTPCSGLSFDSIDQIIEYRKSKDPYIRVFLNDLVCSNNAYVLDLGCGQGPDITEMSRTYTNVFGCDLSMGSLQQALQLNPSLTGKIIQSDARILPYKSDCFDAIYSNGVIHHSVNIEESISEIYRVLKPGGKGRVMVYRKYSLKGMIVRLMRHSFRSPSLLKIFRRVFRNSGSAVDELFLCPVMGMYSAKEMQKLFGKFNNIELKSRSIGFSHFLCMIGVSNQNPINRAVSAIEMRLEQMLGFYWIITFNK